MLNSIGVVQRRAGRAAEALAAHEQALELAGRVGTDVEKAEILNDLGLSLRSVGRRDRALASHRQALTLARRLRDPYEEARALDGIGNALPADAAEKAARYRRDAATLFASLGVPRADGPTSLPPRTSHRALRLDCALRVHNPTATGVHGVLFASASRRARDPLKWFRSTLPATPGTRPVLVYCQNV